MKRVDVPNLTLAALVASCFIQIGAQLFALVVVAWHCRTSSPAFIRNARGGVRL